MNNSKNKYQGWFMCFLAALFYCYEYIIRVIPSVLVPDLMLELHIGASQIGLITSFYFITYTPMQILVGPIIDNFGVRKLLTLSVILCAFGILLFSYNNISLMKLGMFMSGLGSAFAFVSVLKIAADWLDHKYFALVTGLTTTLGMIGAIFGETLASLVIEIYGKSTTLEILSIIGMLLSILIFKCIKDKNKNNEKTFKSEFANLFVYLISVAKNKQIWVNGLIGLFLIAPTTAFAGLWGVAYFTITKHITTLQASALVSSIFIGWIIGSPIIGILSEKLKTRKKILVCGSILTLILMVKIIFYPASSYHIVSFNLFLLGLFSSSEILVFAVAHDITAKRASGTAVSLTNMIVMISGALYYIIGVLLELTTSAVKNSEIVNTNLYSETSFQVALSILPIGLFVAMLLCFFLKESYKD